MDWQQIAALAIVALAALWLIRTQILAPRRDGCGGCGSRSPDPASQPGTSQIVQIDLEPPGSRARR
jgi:hypothetical protein